VGQEEEGTGPAVLMGAQLKPPAMESQEVSADGQAETGGVEGGVAGVAREWSFVRGEGGKQSYPVVGRQSSPLSVIEQPTASATAKTRTRICGRPARDQGLPRVREEVAHHRFDHSPVGAHHEPVGGQVYVEFVRGAVLTRLALFEELADEVRKREHFGRGWVGREILERREEEANGLAAVEDLLEPLL